MAKYGGSPLVVLAILVVCNSALWTLIYSLQARLLVRWSCLALPALTLLPLWHGGGVCRKLVQTPGTEEALARLYRLLALTQ